MFLMGSSRGRFWTLSVQLLIGSLETEFHLTFELKDELYWNLDSIDKIEKMINSHLAQKELSRGGTA